MLTPEVPAEALRLHLIWLDELEEEEVVDDGDRADEEHRSGDEEESSAGVPADELVAAAAVAVPAGPVGLGVPALLREDEEEEEEDVGDKIELLLRAFLCGLRHVLPAPGSLFTMCCASPENALTEVFISQSEPEWEPGGVGGRVRAAGDGRKDCRPALPLPPPLPLPLPELRRAASVTFRAAAAAADVSALVPALRPMAPWTGEQEIRLLEEIKLLLPAEPLPV